MFPGDTNPVTRTGHCYCECDVHGVTDGLPSHCLFSKIIFVLSKEYLILTFFKAVWSEKAPFLIVAILSLFGAFPGLFLPETADVHLPDSLEEIEEFGR